ncbi:GAF and PAS/PAC sensor-containing adenylate/guanylate cyclase [Gorgonomyces haynaldii]|nr:GAF and PAS/PAC sensor-containing adenylate/guanylate cyclase [Gorgonomyces haynaldii]
MPPVSIMAIPLYSSDNNVIGVLEAENKLGDDGQPTYFMSEDENLFKLIGAIGSSVLGNAKLYETMAITQKNIEVLLATTRSLGSITDHDKLIKVIMDSAKDLLSADRCTLFLDDKDRKKLKGIIQGRDGVQTISIPYTTGVAGASFTKGEPVNIHDAYKDSRFNPEVDRQTGYVTRTILCMPIKNIHGECIGVTQMINKRKGVFSAADEMILSSFSAQAAVAIEKSQLFKDTEDMKIYLQSVLSSINSSVITLTDTMRLNTINRPWMANVLDTSEQFMRDNSAELWIGELNQTLVNDIKHVYTHRTTVFGSEYELRGRKTSVIVNYQVMPLISGTGSGSKGVVLVVDDISAEKRAVMTLGRYMSPALAKQVMEDGNGALGGTRKKVSILFSDIRSFTTLSEGMEPTDVVDMLNHHFTDAVNAITEEQGILDKFIGDAVMAVFGVPFQSDDDAIHACNTALKMKDALAISNKARAAAGKQTIKIGIGINTGMVLSGNIGSVKRMEFSCIGDAVNLASRVEGLTKFYGITIMITEYTLKETNDLFITREIEPVQVMGKKKGVRMFELLGRKGEAIPRDIRESISLYTAGFDFYKKRLFEQASEMFNAAIAMSGDGPSKVLLQRSKQYMEQPPDENWDGTYIAEGK